MSATSDTDHLPITLPDFPDDLITIHPDRVSGAPCFAGTRVPIQNLFDYLEGGESIDDFLEGFPGISRQQVIGVLRLASESLLQRVQESRFESSA